MTAPQPAADKLSIRYVPLADARRWERNPKPHDLEKLIESFQRYGFKDPPKFEPDLQEGGGTVEGNGRIEGLELMKERELEPPRGIAVRKDGVWTVPILFGVDAHSQAEAEAYAIDHNALVLMGGNFEDDYLVRLYNQDDLVAVLGDFDEGLLPLSLGEDGLAKLLGEGPSVVVPEPKVDEAAELQKKWGVELGQLWLLGEHRLLCGDATKAEDAQRVLGDSKPLLLVTDPPYGVDYDPNWRRRSRRGGALVVRTEADRQGAER